MVVVGAHEAAERRIALLEGTQADVVRVAPPIPPAALDGAFLVLVCTDDPAVSEALEPRARRGEFLLAALDSDRGAIEMPAVVRRGRLQVAISTSGAAPGLSARLRQALERLLPDSLAVFVERLAALRAALSDRPPAQRRERMKEAVREVEIEGRLKLPE